MSAPLVVNTVDGAVWTRREAVRDGLPLYALAGCERCPELVMATYAELVEHGITGTADVLPVPVGPEPQGDPLVVGRALDLLALMDERAASKVSPVLSAVLDEVERLRMVRAEIGDEIARFGIYGAALPATKALVKRADELVTENAQMRARIAELEAERHSTNEALSDAAEALRARQGDDCSCPPVDRPHQVGCPLDGVPASSERPVNELTATFMPVSSLREDAEREAVRRSVDAQFPLVAELLRGDDEHRTPHGLPESGGAR